MTALPKAPFALRVVERKTGKAAIVYRRTADTNGRDRLQRIASLSPLAFTAATPMLLEAVNQSALELDEFPGSSHRAGDRERGHTAIGSGSSTIRNLKSEIRDLSPGRFLPLDADWGARIACFALLASGLRDGERLLRAVGHLRRADGNEAAWWLGMLTQNGSLRALRALRILTEAVE